MKIGFLLIAIIVVLAVVWLMQNDVVDVATLLEPQTQTTQEIEFSPEEVEEMVPAQPLQQKVDTNVPAGGVEFMPSTSPSQEIGRAGLESN